MIAKLVVVVKILDAVAAKSDAAAKKAFKSLVAVVKKIAAAIEELVAEAFKSLVAVVKN